ncbi:MAG: FliA/WhiG family RNA polymerase sigma factor [Labilithrix sp.]|nr:FliA/WhiG family RNA polymerase sigma factor [Labilithrix sp.]
MSAVAVQEARAKRTLSRAEYERFLPLVRRTAMKLARRLPSHVTVADLVSYGWVGLLDAFERASPDMDADEFEAYAVYRVRGAALDHLRTLDPASRAARALSRKLARAVAELTSERGGDPPSEEQIAARLEMSVAEYRAALERLGRAGMDRLEMLDIDELEVGGKEEGPDERATRKELTGVVAAAIDALPERHRLVLALYYQEERTMREIGSILEVSESRVCQIHTEAIHRLRAAAGRE